jgi:putative MATE family efflux protein
MYNNRKIWNVSYPVLLGLLAQNIINVIDTAFLGRVSEVALGASALGGLLYICVLTVAFGFSVGSQILIARRNGEGRYSDIGVIVQQGIIFMFILAVILFFITRFVAPTFIDMVITNKDINQATNEFLSWRMFGFFFSFINAIFRAFFIGITKTKVITMNAIVMALANVVLDYAMIFGHFGFPEWGIKGAAIASVISEALSTLFFLLYTYGYTDFKKYGLKRIKSFDFPLLSRILNISSFTMFQYFLSMSVWFVFFVAIERIGQRELAIANIVRSIYVVLLIPVQALSVTANSLVSNLIGSEGASNVMKLLGKISKMSLLIMVACASVTIIFPKGILSVYTNEIGLINEAIPSLYVISIAMIVASVSNIYFNGISGTGNTKAALILETITLAIYTIYIFVIALYFRSPVSVCFSAEIVYYLLMLICSILYFKKGKWQDKKI